MKTSVGYWGYPAAPARMSLRRFCAIAVLLLLGAIGIVLIDAYISARGDVADSLNEAANDINRGSYRAAYDTLTGLPENYLSAEQTLRARHLLTSSVLGLAEEKWKEGDLKGSQDLLMHHLHPYVSDDDFTGLASRLDVQRLQVAEQLARAGQYREAIEQYAAIPETSPHHQEAVAAISKLWADLEKPTPAGREGSAEAAVPEIADLLDAARKQLDARHLMIPPGKGAYGLCLAVLSLDPENHEAREIIGRIGSYYRARGDRRYREGDYRHALESYYRYLVVNPGDRGVREKADRAAARLSRQMKPERWEEERTARLLLDSLGSQADSPMILDFLFPVETPARLP